MVLQSQHTTWCHQHIPTHLKPGWQRPSSRFFPARTGWPNLNRLGPRFAVASNPSLSPCHRPRNAEWETVGGAATDERLMQQAQTAALTDLMGQAAALRSQAHDIITFSPKVFLPFTRLCRDSCGYCTFAQPPVPGRRCYMTLDEMVAVARMGAAAGCTEALFTLGDKPELLYPEAAAELRAMGHETTLSYVAEAASAVLRETGLLPHVNAGVMSAADVRALRLVSASQGLMLESMSRRLLEPGGPHHDCPDKDPTARLATIEAAGQAGVPFTTGLLIGIGETREERLDTLFAIRDLHERYGHIQEVIVQNFRAKKGTRMAAASEPSLNELLWTVTMARLILGPNMNIQAPPNLTPIEAGLDATDSTVASWRALLDAGINDWGGLSPLTRDFVNPEKPWPHIQALAETTAAAGFALLPRLPVYPAYIRGPDRWLARDGGRASVAAGVLRSADAAGLARGSAWCPGTAEDKQSLAATSQPTTVVTAQHAELPPPVVPDGSGAPGTSDARHRSSPLPGPSAAGGRWQIAVGADGLMEGCAGPAVRPQIAQLLHAVLEQDHELSETDMVQLFAARGTDFHAVVAAADELRRRTCGDTVSYVVNRNINYTNVCTYKCQFCAFSKGKASENLRGAPYLLPLEEITRRTAEAWQRGATEVCMQGGIHPDFNGQTYLDILAAAKRGAPDIHVHAFSPLEVHQGAATLDWPLRRFLLALKDAGLGSLPGTAAEVLHDGVRAELCPDKLSTTEWLEVIETAHEVGLRTTSTIMFGHVDQPPAWAQHLRLLRDVQKRTGGITEFVPLPFVHMQAPIFLKGRSRRGPVLRECIMMHALARLALHPHIMNVQASWVKMGAERAAALLTAGCNDMGGSLMNESITRAAGAEHGQELSPAQMEALILQIERLPRQRTTTYGSPVPMQVDRSFGAAALSAVP